jgi:type IV pilus assembly protein PilC
MKRFDYKATERATGKSVKGSIQANDERSAGKLLLEQGYIPDVIEAHDKDTVLSKYKNKIRAKDRILFTRQFATLIGVGLPLAASLRSVSEQTQSKAMKAVIEEISASVESGKTLHESFARRPDIFNNVYLSLIKAGEMSGTLDIALKRLADQEEKDEALLSRIRGALIYPAIILVVIIAVLAFMMIAVVPQVDALYTDLKKPLPELTKFLVGMTNFFGAYWWLVGMILFALVGGLAFYFKSTKPGQKTRDSIKIHVPIFGGLFRKLYVSRFARTAEMMLATGVPMLDSVKIAIGAANNIVVEEEYSKSIDIIKGGKPLSEAIKDREYMLPLVPQMAAIGEESGRIDEMLGKAAQVYETELDQQINTISTMIEPVLMVIMAGLIGVVIGGTLLPIYSLVSQITM